MKNLNIEIEWLHSGQPRPYADSVYEFNLRFTKENGVWTPIHEQVKEIAKGISNRGKVNDSYEEKNWYDPYIEKCEKIADNEWHIKIIEPYTD